MSRALLVLRPEPGASATEARARALGWQVTKAPLFAVAAREWEAPDPAGFDALLFTSARAAQFAGPALALYHGLPVYAVGAATGAAVRAEGFADVREGESSGIAIVQRAMAEGATRLLHLAGREHGQLAREGLTLTRRIVYAADAARALPEAAREALAGGAVALAHSPRAAALLGALLGEEMRGQTRLAAISSQALAAAGFGWKASTAPAQPTDEALLAASARLCDQERERSDDGKPGR